MRATQSDYIMRMIEQLGAALRRLREMLARDASSATEVIQQVEAAQAALFGDLWPVLRQVTAKTALELVPDTRRVELWIDLLQVESRAAELLGEDVRAEQTRQRWEALHAALMSSGRGRSE
jgi:hypothetical protein